MHNARSVVRDADLGRGDGEGGRVGADDHVARQAEVAGAAPDRSVHTGDDGDRGVLDAAEQLFHRNVVSQRVVTGLGQFVNVVAGAPYALVALRFDDDADALVLISLHDGFGQFPAHHFAQAVEMFAVLHFDQADPVLDGGVD